MTLVDKQSFWQWAYSDFLSNAQRGVLAEYIVAQALGATETPRKEWDAVDLVTSSGIKVEVKSAAYLQRWEQKKKSDIRFDIANKKSWDADTNITSTEALRSADVYVFCLYTEETDKSPERPLNLDKWDFLVCSTAFLNLNFPNQKTIGMAALEQAGLKRVSYSGLCDELERVTGNPHPSPLP